MFWILESFVKSFVYITVAMMLINWYWTLHHLGNCYQNNLKGYYLIDALNFTIFKKITDRTCLSTRSLVSNYTDTFKFVVDDVLKKLKNSKLKGFSFYKGKVIEVVVRIGSSLHFHRERDLYLSIFQVRIVIVFTSISI